MKLATKVFNIDTILRLLSTNPIRDGSTQYTIANFIEHQNSFIKSALDHNTRIEIEIPGSERKNVEKYSHSWQLHIRS